MAFPIAQGRRRRDQLLVVLGILMLTLPLGAAPSRVRIAQTLSAGDGLLLIDPATNKVVERIIGIERPHGVKASPDGTRLYVTSMGDRAMEVVDVKTLKVTAKIPTSGMPHNFAISKDGKRLYVGIQDVPGGVDVIDTTTLKLVKTIPGEPVHNVWISPDGKYVVAGCNQGGPNLYYVTVIDQQTEEPAWTVYFTTGVRPLTMDWNPDGSTRRIYLGLSRLNGFAVLDFETRREVARIEFPNDVPPEKQETAATGVLEGGNTPQHGIGVSPDGKTLWACSLMNSRVYAYSLPDLKFLGAVPVGRAPYWLTFSPDSKTVYVTNAMTGTISVVDVASRKELMQIPVGNAVPERSETVMLEPGPTGSAQ